MNFRAFLDSQMRMFITKPQFQLNNSIPVTTSKWTTVDEESATPAPDEDFVKSTSVLPAPDEATTPELNRELNFLQIQREVCSVCRGQGFVSSDRCHVCSATGEVEIDDSVKLRTN